MSPDTPPTTSTASAAADSATADSGPQVQRLKANAVGLTGVVFMAVATAAPITAMIGNVPIAVGFGNGAGAPAGYLVATVILGLFALGYSAMSKHITSTGAFYGFISHGLGRIVGMAAGSLTTLAYVVFEAALVGIFSFFANNFFKNHMGIDISWVWYALAMLLVNTVLTYFDVNLTAKVLGFFLITEILILGAMTVSVIGSGGGPEGWSWSSLNPLSAFDSLSGVVADPLHAGSTIAVAGSAGIGLFFAFWSWVGFESTAMYGEESRNPKKIIPIATMVAVLGVGIFYVIVSWSALVGTGPSRAIAYAQHPDTAGNMFFIPIEQHLGHWSLILVEFLMMTGSYACGMAFHNCASRYIYAIGREDLIPGMSKTLGASHAKHGSPHIAGFIQTAIATVIVLFFFFSDRNPYTQLYTLMAILGTTAILIVQALAAFSCVSYFHVMKMHPESANWFRTLVAPLLGGIGMLGVGWLLIKNAGFAAGDAASDLVFKLSPWVVGVVGLSGLLFALWTRKFAPAKYEIIGRVVLDDSSERDEDLSAAD
ncbi:APC family permease [Gordonia aichiensis]|uniref:APC family permease n=1 Tax=Gordonia aichiensis TaxID=36820 RepID=UPI003D767541